MKKENLIGKRVFHRNFGPGTVTRQASVSREDDLIVVSFDYPSAATITTFRLPGAFEIGLLSLDAFQNEPLCYGEENKAHAIQSILKCYRTLPLREDTNTLLSFLQIERDKKTCFIDYQKHCHVKTLYPETVKPAALSKRLSSLDVYCLSDYVPISRGQYDASSKAILCYKNRNIEAFSYFTKQLFYEILFLTESVLREKKICLVAVPSSNPLYPSPIVDSIRCIVAMYNTWNAPSNITKKKLLDGHDLLFRANPVQSLHFGGSERNALYESHYFSLRKNVFHMQDDCAVIILDDIVTQGITLQQCAAKLLEGNSSKLSIIGLTLGMTKLQ